MQVHGLYLGSHIDGAYSQFFISPTGPSAAVFVADGKRNVPFHISIPSGVIILKGRRKNRANIILTNFQYAGSVNRDGNGFFPRNGRAKNIRIGALCIIPREARSGRYRGRGIVRITYI
jgi:hypothetical protein